LEFNHIHNQDPSAFGREAKPPQAHCSAGKQLAYLSSRITPALEASSTSERLLCFRHAQYSPPHQLELSPGAAAPWGFTHRYGNALA